MDFCLHLGTTEILKGIKEDSKKNIVFSPFTTNCMLNMVASGSEGDSLRQLLHFLGSPNIDDLNSRSSRMIDLATVKTVADEDSEMDEVPEVPEGPERMSFGNGDDLRWEKTTFGSGNYPYWTIGEGNNPSRESTTAFGVGIDPSRDKNAISFGIDPSREKIGFGIGNVPCQERSNAFGVGIDPSWEKIAFGIGNDPSRDRTNAFGVGIDPSRDRTAFGVGIDPSRDRTAFGVGINPSQETTNAFGVRNDPSSERAAFGIGNDPSWERTAAFGIGNDPSRESTAGFGIGNDPSRQRNGLFGFGNDPSWDRTNAFGTNAFGVGIDPSRDRTNAFGVGIDPSRDRTNAFGVGIDPSRDRTAFGVGINPSRETTSAFGVGNNPSWGRAAFGIRNNPSWERTTPFGIQNDPSCGRTRDDPYRNRTAAFGIGNDPSRDRTASFGIGNDPSRQRTASFGIGNDPYHRRIAAIGIRNDPFLERTAALGIRNDPYLETAFGIGNDRLWQRTTGTRNGHHPPRDEKGVTLTFAGGIWIDGQYPLKSSFQKAAKDVYRAEAKAVDFKTQAMQVEKEINLWAETETKGLIRELIAPGLLCKKPEPAIVLANALYFKGAWDDPFKPSPSFCDRNFHLLDGGIIRVPFLSGDDRYEYYGSFETFKVLRLPYRRGNDMNKQFSMYIFLPHRDNGLHDMIQEFNSDPGLFHKRTKLEKVKLAWLRIPKFKFSNTFIVSETIQKLGLTLPFQMGGGPTGMVDWEMVNCPNPDKLMISMIIQKSFIEVNEDGTEAAACDAAVVLFGSSAVAPRPKPLHFSADHPFMFMIKEDMSDTVFFTGAVLNPLAQN